MWEKGRRGVRIREGREIFSDINQFEGGRGRGDVGSGRADWVELANRFRREEVSLICLTRWRRGQEAVASELVSQGTGPFAVEHL